MSRPYQFTEDKNTRSPLDRQPQTLYPAGQPPSFKTIPGRAKTKRWVEAKTVDYGGDDWGEYDEYDEYGANEEPPAPPSNPSGPTGLRQKGMSLAESGRSFTVPQPPHQPIPRKNSFDAGDERRAFSSAAPQNFSTNSPIDNSRNGGFAEPAPTQNQQYAAHNTAQPQPINTQVPPGIRQPSATQSDISDTPQHRRDFSPSALPPPLHTRVSPAPGSASGSPAGARFPPRKSSISSPSDAAHPQFSASVPSNDSAQPLRARTPSNPTKPLPFIRPADIYKRVEEERVRERQSLDSGRPSLDSLSSRPAEEPAQRGLRERTSADSLGRGGRRPSVERLSDAGEPGKSLQSLEPVAERKSEYLPEFNIAGQGGQSFPSAPQQRPAVQTYQAPALPEVQRFSGFAEDFSPRYFAPDSATSQTTTGLSPQQASGDPGLRSMVDQAFTRKDDSSVPPTPISKRGTYSTSDAGISRSNTESSSGISPIMSRVPSSATSVLKAKNVGGAETSTPAIAEETSEANTPTSRPQSVVMLGGGYKVNRKPSPAHSRNVSSSSLVGTPPHQAGLHTPSPADSPARSPAIEPQSAIPEPEAAILSTLSPVSSGNASNIQTTPNYATREADIATMSKTSPEIPGQALGAVEKESQQAFLESHGASISDLKQPSRSRSESPSKGRVQELAGKFDNVSQSRRGSAHSSIASWERSQEDLPSTIAANNNSKPSTRDPSPVKGALSQRPGADRELSFRPHLPGQWESYTTNAPTPFEESNKDRQIGGAVTQFDAPATQMDKKSDTDEGVDLTPTTQRHSAAVPKPDPLAALQAAGNAMGEALKVSVGLGTASSEPEKSKDGVVKATPGNVYLRPLQLDRTASSTSMESSNPPSPPPKDRSLEDLALVSGDEPPPPPLKKKTPDSTTPLASESTSSRSSTQPQLTTEPAAHDQENDRLREDIVRSLSPLKHSDSSLPEPPISSLQPVAASANNRESSFLPSEYDSYWADGDPDKDVSRQSVVQPSHPGVVESAPSTEDKAPDSRPGLLDNRFSWERSLEPIPQVSSNVPAVTTSPAEPEVGSSIARNVSESSHKETYTGIPEPYFGPGHAVPRAPTVAHISEPEPKPESKTLDDLTEVHKKAENTTHPTTTNLTSPSSPVGRSSSEGLHVVNSTVNPEAVDMPPRLAEEKVPVKVEEPLQKPRPISHEVPLGPRSPTSKGVPQPGSASDKPLGFREILAIRSAPDRIATYNKTRDYWATTDHGLNEWMTKALAASPEHASFPGLTGQLTLNAPAPGSMRHKPTGSLSLFGKSTGSSSQPPATPYYEQYNAAASNMPPGIPPTTPSGTPYQQTPSTGGAGGRSTSHQLEKKGKDLLHNAGKFGGKATTGAKGLFAKGKSRFKSGGSTDKASRTSISSAPTSREPSEEPEWTTAPKQFEIGRGSVDKSRNSVDQGDPKDKKRRLSSPFRRSRSRPTSIVLPKNQHLDHANGSIHSRDTPPRETPPRETLPAEGSLPQPYSTPDSWNTQDPHSQHNANMSSPQTLGTPERLGVLPSPAKSAFSIAQAEREGDVPPVPPIPGGMEDRQQQKEREQDIQSHRNLQSVIRHSTPPALETLQAHGMGPVPAQQAADRASEQPLATQQNGAPIAVEEKREPSWPLKSNSPSPEETGGLAPALVNAQLQETDDDDDRPPQLNHDPLPTSATASTNAQAQEADDDDRPPQVHNEPSPVSALPEHMRQPVDVSPTSAPQASDPGDISPVVSSVGHDPSDDDDRAPPSLDMKFLSRTQPQRGDPGDVSPVVAPRQPGFSSDERQDAVRPRARESTPTPTPRPAYETEQIGVGDVSPVSEHGGGFPGTSDETTPTKPAVAASGDRPGEEPSPISRNPSFQAPLPQPPSLATPSAHIPGAFLETPMETPGENHHQAERQLGADRTAVPPSHFQGNNTAPTYAASNPVAVNHAMHKGIDDYEPSRSSLDSWENDSTGEQLSLSHDRPSAGRHGSQEGVATAITPQAARTVQIGNYFPPQQAKHPQNTASLNTVPQAAHHPPVQERSVSPLAYNAPQKPSQASQPAGSHKRTQSLLSTISNAVSRDGITHSPVSDRSQTSRPGSSQRQMPTIAAGRVADAPPKQQTVLAPPRQTESEHLSPIHDDGFDLYADHNGIVKDLHDEKTGEPLRIVPPASSAPAPPTAQHAQPPSFNFAASPVQQAQGIAESPIIQGGGNLGSRPMSFISLPRDAKGRPQEQINREVHSEEVRPEIAPPQPVQPQNTVPVQQAVTPSPPPPAVQEQNGHVTSPPSVAVGAAGALAKETGASLTDGERQPQLVHPQASAPVQGQPGPVLGQSQSSGVQSPTSTQQQQAVGPAPPQGQYVQDPRMQAPRAQDTRLQDPRLQDPRLQDPRIQDPRLQDPRMQDPRLQDPRLQDPRLQDPRLQDPRLQDPKLQDPRLQDPRLQDPRMQDPRVSPDPRMQQMRMQDPRMQDPRIQDPRAQAMGPGQPNLQDPRRQQSPPQGQQGPPQGQPLSPQDPRLQGRTPSQGFPQDPRMQGAQFGPPRNEYEAQQQMMARQAMDPRLLAAEYQLPGVGPPKDGRNKTPEAGRPKLGSVFKSLGKGQTPPPTQPAPNNRINPQLTSPDDQHRSFSYQSSVGDLPTEQAKDKKKERKSSLFSALSSRPQSVGNESQFSQESRVAHAADSRVDLRYPASPAPFKGIPPQVPPPGAPQPPKPQPQPHRASTSLVPEGGKKKRFSGLGSLFGRSGSTGHVPPPKPQKLSKEEKKKLKAPVQQFQQPQRLPIQGYGQPPVFQQYGGPPGMPPQGPGMMAQAPRMMPQGVQQYIPPQQGAPQQYTSPQPPPGVQSYAPQRPNPQQYYPQPQNPAEAYRQSQPPLAAQGSQQQYPLQRQTSSEANRYPTAYAETRQLAQAAAQPPPGGRASVSPAPTQASRQMSPQNFPPGPPSANLSTEQSTWRISEQGETPPPGGFYDPRRLSHGQGSISVVGTVSGHPATGSRPQDQRRVSSPTSMHGSNNGISSPVSQRSVSSPISEPRYETPQIPAAYSNGASHASPASRTPSLPNQAATAARKSSSPSPYNGPVRQYSDPHRPDLSPQVSGQSQYDSAGGYRDSVSPPVVSPVSNPTPSMPPQQNPPRKSSAPRMGSISEATHQERPYNISLPIDEGAEHEASYIRQQQMHQQQMHQQQIEAENQTQGIRNGHTPSPVPPQAYGRPPSAQGAPAALAGFREVLPRHSPQPYQMPPPQQQPISHPQQSQLQPLSHSRTPEPVQPAPMHPHQLQNNGGPVQPAALPLPMSPVSGNSVSPVNPLAAMLPPPPPPKVPHSPFVPHHPTNDVVDDEAPPSYASHDQPGQIYNDEKTQPLQPPTSQIPPTQLPPPQMPPPQPPQQEYVPGDGPTERGRKPSLSILQHPQPSTMAASPSRSSTDMGSAILRQRLLEQEERDRIERIQQSELERIESQRERADRERARARARELERSRGSVRSHMGATGSSGQRPIAFELSAEEDDEPVMRGVSYPGMEWTPAWDGE